MREYKKEECACFFRTTELYGELSNFSSKCPIRMGGETFTTSEALYQALRFPYNPEIQKKICLAKTPSAAKDIARVNYGLTRPDWMAGVRVKAMMFTIANKYQQNKEIMSKVFVETTNKPIVEISKKDDYWGAIEVSGGVYRGENILGNLLTTFRDNVLKYETYHPNIKDFLLFDELIEETPF